MCVCVCVCKFKCDRFDTHRSLPMPDNGNEFLSVPSVIIENSFSVFIIYLGLIAERHLFAVVHLSYVSRVKYIFRIVNNKIRWWKNVLARTLSQILSHKASFVQFKKRIRQRIFAWKCAKAEKKRYSFLKFDNINILNFNTDANI